MKRKKWKTMESQRVLKSASWEPKANVPATVKPRPSPKQRARKERTLRLPCPMESKRTPKAGK